MPPKAKITRDMVIEAGLAVISEYGEDALNVRSIAKKLGCSTQPVMYHFKSVDELKAVLYKAADDLHTGYIMNLKNTDMPMLEIGMNYIRFADEKRNLFRFLFQSGKIVNTGFNDLMNGSSLDMLIAPLCAQTGLSHEKGREAFRSLFICVHGIASLLANNSISYDKADFEKILTDTFMGIVGQMKRGN